jgi:hypothetical protein
MKALVLSLGLLLAIPAMADIIEWRDGNGVRHYTNLKEEVPADYRAAAQVVIDEAVRHHTVDADVDKPPVVAAPESQPPRQAQVVYDRPNVDAAYIEGLERGLEMAQLRNQPPPAEVQINGPLAIANAQPPVIVAPLRYPYPYVTTAFDGGRSRHLTLRMRLQDQFAFDRGDELLFPVDGGFGRRSTLPRRVVGRVPCGADLIRR